MSNGHDSTTIEIEPTKLLKLINDKEKLTAFGYMRMIALNEYKINIPESIINYIILYTYLLWHCWLKCGPRMNIKGPIVEMTESTKMTGNTVYGNNVIDFNYISHLMIHVNDSISHSCVCFDMFMA